MKRRRISILFCLGAIAAGGLWGQTSMSLSPVQMEIALSPGQSEERVLTVGNDSPEAIRIKAEIVLWTPGAPGVEIVPAEGAAGMTCRDWIRMETPEFTVASGENHDVTLAFAVPENTEPGHYTAAVSFQAVSDKPGEGISIQGKLSALAVVAVGKIRNEGTIEDLAVENIDGRSILILRHKNNGRFFLPTEGEIVIRNEAGKKVYKADIFNDPVPPLSERMFRIPMDTELPPGRYEAECVLRPLSGKKESLNKPITIDHPGKP